MLYLATVEPDTLALLKKLQSIPELKEYRLVGGTALALRMGHRRSIDLDLFCHGSFDEKRLKQILAENKIKVTKAKAANVYYGGFVDGIKVDFVKDFDGWLKSAESSDGIRIARMEDLAPMKLNAITGRGKKKDFSDLYYLLQRYSVNDLLELYRKRTRKKETYHVLMSMTYFEDAEQDEMPYMFDKKLTWEKIKKKISDEVIKFTRNNI